MYHSLFVSLFSDCSNGFCFGSIAVYEATICLPPGVGAISVVFQCSRQQVSSRGRRGAWCAGGAGCPAAEDVDGTW